jgi:hypothetical protein
MSERNEGVGKEFVSSVLVDVSNTLVPRMVALAHGDNITRVELSPWTVISAPEEGRTADGLFGARVSNVIGLYVVRVHTSTPSTFTLSFGCEGARCLVLSSDGSMPVR